MKNTRISQYSLVGTYVALYAIVLLNSGTKLIPAEIFSPLFFGLTVLFYVSLVGVLVLNSKHKNWRPTTTIDYTALIVIALTIYSILMRVIS